MARRAPSVAALRAQLAAARASLDLLRASGQQKTDAYGALHGLIFKLQDELWRLTDPELYARLQAA